MLTDKVRAQLYLLKPEEGGAKTPIASFFQEHIYSLTWNHIARVEIIDKDKDFIMPGEHAEVILHMNTTQFMMPQQRFTLRNNDNKTVGCGVFLDLLPPMTEEEKDKKARRQQMKTVMEKLGFNPYPERWLLGSCKPDFTNSPRDHPAESLFHEEAA